MSGSMSGSMSGVPGDGGAASGPVSGSMSGSGAGRRFFFRLHERFLLGLRAPAAAPADGDGWMTRLVNAANPLPEGFTVETVDIRGYENRPFDKRAAADLEAMLADAEAAGCKLYLVSGYRAWSGRRRCSSARQIPSWRRASAGRRPKNRLPCGWRVPAPRSITRPCRRYRFGGLVFEAQRPDGGF